MRFPVSFFPMLFLMMALPVMSPAQIELQKQTSYMNRSQPFYFEALNYGETDEYGITDRLDIYVQIPYDIISFVKKEGGYVGKYSVTVQASYPEDGKLIREESWNKVIELQTFAQTRNSNSFDLSTRSMKLEPGPVIIEAIFEDQESGKEYRVSKKIQIAKFDKNLFGMSDIMLVSQVLTENGKRRIVPQINPNVAVLKNDFHLFYEIYNPFTLDRVRIGYKITKRNQLVFEKTDVEPCHVGTNTFVARIAPTGLSVGSYLVNVTVYHTDDSSTQGILAKGEKHFNIEWLNAGGPISITDLDEAVEQLKYFAKPADLDYIKEAKDDKEKRKRFEDFWERNNPTPGTPTNRSMVEYYNRVAYANEHFHHYIDGWKTDRGMVYIMYGAPDAVDRHPVDVESKPYEIWEYYEINRRFVFIDETGFGDFHLLYPIWDDRNRLR